MASLGVEYVPTPVETVFKLSRGPQRPYTKKSENFSTSIDNQSNIKIPVLQGERKLEKDNKSLRAFRLERIAPILRGIPQIEVSFESDVNCILSVTAKDKATNQQQSITISDASNLAKNEIDRIIQKAEQISVK